MPEPARERLRQAGITESWDPDRDNVSLPAALVLARVLAASASTSEAGSVIGKVISQARAAGEILVLAEALCVRATLSAHNQDWPSAAHDFAEASSLARNINYRYAEARILYESGLTRPEGQGREELEQALRIFRELGAQSFIEQVAAALEGHSWIAHPG
jgi:hypothetical protein